MSKPALNLLKRSGQFFGSVFRFLPRSFQSAVMRVFCAAITHAPRKLSSGLFLFGYQVGKRMYRDNKQPVLLQRTMGGIFTMKLDVTKKTQRILYLQKIYEPYLASYLTRTLSPGDTFIDIGANVGYFTLLAARQVGEGGRVIAFEPEQNNYAALVLNVRLNKLQNITCVQKAVGAKEGFMSLHVNPLNEGGSSLIPILTYADDEERWSHEKIREKFPDTALEQKTEVITLDHFLTQNPLQKQARVIIKIDVESAELEVLQGMRELLARTPTLSIVCEVTREGEKIAALLNERGYTIRALKNDGGSSPLPRADRVQGKALLFMKESAILKNI